VVTLARTMFPFGIFGIDSDGLNLAVNLLILCLVVIWLATVYWTYADARRRIEDPMLVACATAAAVFPFVGVIVYMIVRPPEFLDDVRERELEMQAAEARVAQLGYMLCPHCDAEIERDFLRCPNCMRRLKNPCASCSRPLDPVWKVCPYCETEVVAGEPQPSRRRRRRTGTTAEQAAVAEAPPSP
jgi:Double zinc ribbon